MLAIAEICWNMACVCVSSLLFYMINKMTMKVNDAYFDIRLKRDVPFFVYLANWKIALAEKSRAATE